MPGALPRPSSMPSNIPTAAIESFQSHLVSSRRILALLGAGLSASSGLPTFRGAGGLWRTHEATELATPQAFEANPGLVWQFYSYRRHMALQVKPNPAHYALAELAKRVEGFITLSQNVDGLSPRAGHPRERLYLLHGSLFDVKCSRFFCNYAEMNNFRDPIVPALELPRDESDPTSNQARSNQAILATAGIRDTEARELDISDASVPLPEIHETALPHCPECDGLQRPGVVWFGERLPSNVLQSVDDFIESDEQIDLIMVIGTSARVFPAADYVRAAEAKGARVAVINTERDLPPNGLRDKDWFFQGDAAVLVPELLRPVIGDIQDIEEKL